VPEIVLTDFRTSERRLRIHGYKRRDGYPDEYAVEVVAHGLNAAFAICTEVGDRLSEFVRALADDFVGWEGERAWHSLEDELTLIATHHSGGHVKLVWTASRYSEWNERMKLWSVTVTFLPEAGEQMTKLADDLETFFKESH
jgi:Family of unknown function (DUF6228)